MLWKSSRCSIMETSGSWSWIKYESAFWKVSWFVSGRKVWRLVHSRCIGGSMCICYDPGRESPNQQVSHWKFNNFYFHQTLLILFENSIPSSFQSSHNLVFSFQANDSVFGSEADVRFPFQRGVPQREHLQQLRLDRPGVFIRSPDLITKIP